MTTKKKNDNDQPAPPADPVKVEHGEQGPENISDAAYDSLPVTVGNLKKNLPAMLAPILQAMGDQIEERLKQERDATTKQINEANAGMMDTIKGYLEQINASVNNRAQGGGGEAAQPQDTKAQFMQILQPSLEKHLNKILGVEETQAQPDPAVYEFKRNTEMLNRLIYKKAATLTGKMVEKAMKAAMKDGDMVTEEAVALVQDNISHDPTP